MKKNKVNLIYLENVPRSLDAHNIDVAIDMYLEKLAEFPLKVEEKTLMGFLKKIKREKVTYGPYPGVSLFEASNRIMTDLVILFGVKELLNNKIPDFDFKAYEIELGNEHNNEFDIQAQNKDIILRGEAFNVAPSFFQIKKYNSLKKMRRDMGQKYRILLMYNSDATPHDKYTPQLLENEYHLPVSIHF